MSELVINNEGVVTYEDQRVNFGTLKTIEKILNNNARGNPRIEKINIDDGGMLIKIILDNGHNSFWAPK